MQIQAANSQRSGILHEEINSGLSDPLEHTFARKENQNSMNNRD